MGEAKTKRRECPALGRAITAQECGQSRGNRYDCPGDCPHWPFSVPSYDAFQEIERKFDGQLTGACLRLRGPGVFGPKSMGQPADEVEFNALMCWKMFYERDGGGRTMIEQWEADGWRGLSNDGRYLMRYHRGIRPGILEVRRRLGESVTECVEVVRGGVSEPFLICDYGMARHARRFGCFLGWLYRLPSFGRFKGAAVDITTVGDWRAGEALEQLAEINGAPAGGGEEWYTWLARYFCEISGLLQTHQRQAHQVTMASMDARQVRRRYRIVSGRKALVKDLGAELRAEEADAAEEEDVETAEKAWEVHEEEMAAAEAAAQRKPLTMVGKVMLKGEALELEAFSARRMEMLVEWTERVAGKRIVFEEERALDLAKRLAARDAVPLEQPRDGPLRGLPVPTARPLDIRSYKLPRRHGVPQAQELEFWERRMRGAQLEEKVPLLDGLTPLEAAARPELRARLECWAKGWIHNDERRTVSRELVEEHDRMLGRLGLGHLGAGPQHQPAPAEKAPENKRVLPPAGKRPPVVGEEELARRIVRVAGASRRAGDVLEEYFPEACEWLDGQLGGTLEITDDEKILVESLLAILFRVLFPEPGLYRMPDAGVLNEEAEYALLAMNEFFEGSPDRGAATLGEIADTLGGELRQQALFQAGCSLYLRGIAATQQRGEGSPNDLNVLIILRVMLGCWDRAVRVD